MKNRTIVAEEIPVEANVMLAGDVRQVRWKAPAWASGLYRVYVNSGLYRVYVNGRLAVVTEQTWHNFPDAARWWWETARVEVFVEITDGCD